ncbi:Heparinase II/III-like protein [Candidatus Methanoperedenaceae archaeon GB50]|nr:Heparinase II/III-like protein [Candidatus Methanoperedenaceae archaeon GB50]
MKNIFWYFFRLRLMSLPEIIHQIKQGFIFQIYRLLPYTYQKWLNNMPDSLELFSFVSEKHSHLLPIPLKDIPQNFDLKNIDWHLAPDTGKIWPKRFSLSIPYRPGNIYGDARLVWEKARFQELANLAFLYYLKDDKLKEGREIIDYICKIVSSWIDENPPLRGIHYISAMECGLRIIALCFILDILRKRLSSAFWKKVLKTIYFHAKWIEKRLSLFSSLGNHTVAECTGLLYASLLFPEFPEAKRWYKKALKILEKEAEHQILPDGGGIEQAFWYHKFVLDLYGLVIHLLKNKKQKIPEVFERQWERGHKFLSFFYNKKERIPDIGDRDDGFALSPYLKLAPKKESSKWEGIKTFFHSGYTVVSYQSPYLIKLIFDHGPLGMPPAYGHGHADALSILFNIEEDIFIDPGTYTYGGDQRWRKYFRSTSAHNTITVDGKDQAVQKGTFIWDKPYNCRFLNCIKLENGVILIAEHDGYKRLFSPVKHQRAIYINKNGILLILDQIKGKGKHQIELNWHINPKANVIKIEDKLFQINIGPIKGMLFLKGGKVFLVSGVENPKIQGWWSPRYNVRKPAPVLSVLTNMEDFHEFITFFSLNRIDFDSFKKLVKQVKDYLK